MAIQTTVGQGIGTEAMNLADQRRKEMFEKQGIKISDLTKAGRRNLGSVDTETFVPPRETTEEKDVFDYLREEEDAAIRQNLQENTALTPTPVRPENMQELAEQQAQAEANAAQREIEKVNPISKVFGADSFEDIKQRIDAEKRNLDPSDNTAIAGLNRSNPIQGAFWRAGQMATYFIPGSELSPLQLATLMSRSYKDEAGNVIPNWDAALTAADRIKVAKKRGLLPDETTKIDTTAKEYAADEVQGALAGVEFGRKISTKEDTKGQEVESQPDAPIFKDSRLNTNATSIIFHSDLLDAGIEGTNKRGEATLVIDPKFKEIMSLATEAFLMEQMFTADDADTTVSEPDERGYSTKSLKTTASKGSQRLGRDIFQAWKRQQANDLGLETDSYLDTYDQISPAVFTHIGNMAKQFYAAVNPTIFKRTGRELAGEGVNDDFTQTEYELTDYGIDTLTRLHRANWGLFENQEVKPLSAPSETGLFMFEGRTRTKDVTTQIPGREKGDRKLLNEARKNANSVAMVTDQRRLNTALMFGMLGLVNAGGRSQSTGEYNFQNTNNDYANMFGIGEATFNAMKSEKARLYNAAKRAVARKQFEKAKSLQALADSYDPGHILTLEREKFISILEGAGRYSTNPKGNAIPNHLTFAIQALTGRMHAQQTIFNPQAHKLIRFIVGGKNKYQWKPGDNSKLDNNWKEGISAKLFEKKFKKTHGFKRSKEERIKVFNDLANETDPNSQYKKFVRWGNELQALINKFDSRQAKEQLALLKSIQDPTKMGELRKQIFNSISDKNPIKDQILREELAGEKEEAIAMADYLMDLAAYDAAKKNNTHHTSSVIFEADGITHGPSTMAMILGSTGIAKRAGVLMDQDFSQMTKSSDFRDLRDHMARVMRASLEEVSGALGVSHDKETYNELLELAIKDRDNFLKQSPMTMGYGQEIASLIDHVDTTIFLNPDIDELIKTKLDGNYNSASDFLHSILVDSIYKTFDTDTIKASKQIKNNAYASALTDLDIIIDAPAGNALAILGGESVQKFQTYLTEALYDDNRQPIMKKEKIRIGRDDQGNPIYQTDEQGNFVYNTYHRTKQTSVTHYGEAYSPSAPRNQGGMRIFGGWTTGRLLPALVQPYDANMIARTLSGNSWNRIIEESTAAGNAQPFVLPIFDAFLVDLGSMNAVLEESNKHHIDSIINHNYVEKVAHDWYNNWKQVINKIPDDKPLSQINMNEILGRAPLTELEAETHSWMDAKTGKGPFRMLAMNTNQLDLQKMFARTKNYTETISIKEWEEKAWRQAGIDAKEALNQIRKKNVKLEADDITGRDLKTIIDVIIRSPIGLNLDKQNQILVKRTAEKRTALIQMVKEQIAKGVLNKNINL